MANSHKILAVTLLAAAVSTPALAVDGDLRTGVNAQRPCSWTEC